jgi:hypothetical protein
MKHLLESVIYNTLFYHVVNIDGMSKLYNDYYNLGQKNIFNKIKYFVDSDLSKWFMPESLEKSIKFFVICTEKEIIGIAKIGIWSEGIISLSFLSVHNGHKGKNISKKLCDMVFRYMKENYPGETLHLTGYSVEGWNYLRPSLLRFSKTYNVPIKEKAIEYIEDTSPETYELLQKSRVIINGTEN